MALATGHPPLFSTDSTQEPTLPLLTLPAQLTASATSIVITNHRLRKIWEALACFCSMTNEAASGAKRLSEKVLLHTMASAMYGLLSISVDLDATDEAIRLGMLCFCSSAFLRWRHIRVPFQWLQNRCRRAMNRLEESCQEHFDTRLMLWLFLTYWIAFRPLLVDESDDVRSRIVGMIHSLDLTTFESIKTSLSSMLWIDIIYDPLAQNLCDKIFAHGITV